MGTDEISPHITTIHDLGESLAYEPDIGQELRALKLGQWSMRFAARSIITCGSDIALQTIPDKDVTKLPGGGVQTNESVRHALFREIEEEVGLVPIDLKPLGVVIEYRKEWQLVQISHCFTGVVESHSQPRTPTEPGSGLLWVHDIPTALTLLDESAGMPGNEYDRQFATARDLSVLRFFAKQNDVLGVT